jgi:hypothetical protein
VLDGFLYYTHERTIYGYETFTYGLKPMIRPISPKGKSGKRLRRPTVTLPDTVVSLVEIALSMMSITTAGTTTASAVARNAANQILSGKTFTFTSSNTGIATVNTSTGVVSPVAVGNVNIIATCEGVTGSIALEVTAAVVGAVAFDFDTGQLNMNYPGPVPIFSVVAALTSASVIEGQTSQVSARVYDEGGVEHLDRVIVYSTEDPTVATVDSSTGFITTIGIGDTLISATCEGVTNTVRIFASVNKGVGAYAHRTPVSRLPTGMTFNRDTGDIEGTVYDAPLPSNWNSPATYPVRATWAEVFADVIASATVPNPVIHVANNLTGIGTLQLPLRQAAGWLVIRPVDVSGLPIYSQNPTTFTAAANRALWSHVPLMPILENAAFDGATSLSILATTNLQPTNNEVRAFVYGIHFKACPTKFNYHMTQIAPADADNTWVPMASAQQRPKHVIVACCLFDGLRDARLGNIPAHTRRNVIVSATQDVAIIGCSMKGAGCAAQDTQGIMIVESVRVKVMNCEIVAPTENVLTGWGETLEMANEFHPRDIEIRGNRMYKLDEWFGQDKSNTKCLFENKAGSRVVVIENEMGPSFNRAGGSAQEGQLYMVNCSDESDNANANDQTIMYNYGNSVGQFVGTGNFTNNPLRRYEISHNFVTLATHAPQFGQYVWVAPFFGYQQYDMHFENNTIYVQPEARTGVPGGRISSMWLPPDVNATAVGFLENPVWSNNIISRLSATIIIGGTSNPSVSWNARTQGPNKEFAHNAILGTYGTTLPLPGGGSAYLTDEASIGPNPVTGVLPIDSPLKAGGSFHPESTEDKGADISKISRIINGALR